MTSFQAFALLMEELKAIGFDLKQSTFRGFAGNTPHIEIFSYLMNDFSPILKIVFQAVDLENPVESPRKDTIKYIARIFLFAERVLKFTHSLTAETFVSSKDISEKLDFTLGFMIHCKELHVHLSKSLEAKSTPTPTPSTLDSTVSSEGSTLKISDFRDTFEQGFPSSSVTSSTSSFNSSFPSSSDLSSSSSTKSDPLSHSSARKMYTFRDYTLSSISSLDMQLWMDTFNSSKGGHS